MRYTISLLCASLALSPAVARAEGPRVVTDIPPVHALVAQVMGDLGSPALLLERGGDAHDMQLRPSQAAALADADLVVWIGPEMSPWLARALDGVGGTGARLELLDVAGTGLRDFAPAEAGPGAGTGHDHAEAEHDHAEAGHDHAEAEQDHAEAEQDHAEAGHDHAEAEQDHGAEAAGHDHAHAGIDPHAWLDPGNAQVWLAAIASEIGRIDPANAAAYDRNAAAAAARLADLDAALAATLAPAQGKPFVVFHDAYGYFADHYGLTVAGSVALGDAASPGAARLRALQAEMAAGGALCIFPEANHDAGLVETMVEGTGVRIGGALDPEGALAEPGPGAHAAILTGLAETLVACLAPAG